MKAISKQFWALLLSAAMLASACGCSSDDNASSSNSGGSHNTAEDSAAIPQAEHTGYKIVSLTSAMSSGSYSDLTFGGQASGGAIYYTKSIYDIGDADVTVCSITPDGNETTLFSCGDLLPEVDSVSVLAFLALQDGNYALIVSGGTNANMPYEPETPDFDYESYYDEDDYQTISALQILSPDGTVISQTELDSDWYGTIQQDSQGNILGFFNGYDPDKEEQYVQICSIQGDTVQTLDPPEGYYAIECSIRGSDGEIYVMASSDDAWNQVMHWDSTQQTLEKVEVDTGNLNVYGFVSSADPAVPFCIYDDKAIYSVQPDSGTLTKILDFVASNLTSSRFNSGAVLENGEIIASLNDTSYNTYLAKLTVNENAGNAQTLTLATYYQDDQLAGKVAEFNSSQEEYRIELKTYDQYDNYESEDEADWNRGRTVFHEDIAAGNIPDLVDVTSLEASSYADKGLYVDLYTMMDQSDAYPREAFLPNVLSAYERDGSLYWMSSCFAVDSVLANDNLTGNKTSWTLEEFVDICQQSLDQGADLMEYQSPTSLVWNMLDGCRLVDEENSTCYFDDPGFVKLLELSEHIEDNTPDYESMSDSEWSAYYSEGTMRYQNGQRLMYNMNAWSYTDYAVSIALFGDQPVTNIGYPTVGGQTGGATLSPAGTSLAITTSCKVPEVAWEFICSLFDGGAENFYGFPVLAETFDAYLEQDLKNLEQTIQGGYVYNDVELSLTMPTQAEQTAFRDWVLSIDQMNTVSSAVSELIAEPVDAFLEGDDTADNTARLLQEKCNLYLKENS